MLKSTPLKKGIIGALKLNLIFLIEGITRQFFRFTPNSFPRFLERAAADAQGKGYGSTSIRQEIEIISRLLVKPPQLAMDIGGNVGDYSAELRRRFSDLEIHTFEPSNVNIEKLNTRFSLDPLIKIAPWAVSDKVGSAILFSDTPGSGLASLTKRKLEHFNIHLDDEQVVPTIRFESYWQKELRSRQIDIVKIDIEGHELAALEGFGSAIDRVSVLQFEFGGCNIDTRTFFQDFWNFFNQKDFAMLRITPTGFDEIKSYREIDEFFSTTNYIAKNRRIL